MIVLFKYNNKVLKFLPHDHNIDLVDYVNNNMPNGTPYKIVESIDNLTENDLEVILDVPDGFSNNTLF